MTLEQFAFAVMIFNVLTSLVILVRGVFYICNSMDRRTYWPIRFAWVLLCTGSLSVILGPLYGLFVSSVHVTLIHLGVAIYVCSDRRARTRHEGVPQRHLPDVPV